MKYKKLSPAFPAAPTRHRFFSSPRPGFTTVILENSVYLFLFTLKLCTEFYIGVNYISGMFVFLFSFHFQI